MGKWLIFDKWVIASILYVAIVIGGFAVYDQFFADKTQAVSAAKHEHASDDSAHKQTSEVNAFVQADPDKIKIFLKDKIGNPANDLELNHEKLKPDNNFIQNIDGETVKLNLSSTQANEPVTLTFNLDKTNLSPYLGAMGHVVILDENAQDFLHVHPANDKEPIFETQFKQPGIYKIWAEFKQNGKVRAFPFVVEIKGEN